MSTKFPKSSLDFLKKLAKNNNREWFHEHKAEYKLEEQKVKTFFQELMEQMNQHDVIEDMKMFRIYRDVRFSKDKTPYNTHYSCNFKRATAARRGGYYIRIKPGGESMIGGGFWQPNKEDLLRIRKEFEADDQPIREIIGDKKFKKLFGELHGDELKTAPKGFDKEHPAIDLIRKKSFTVFRQFTDKEVVEKDFLKQADETFQTMRPYFDYMSDVLTTDVNGQSLI